MRRAVCLAFLLVPAVTALSARADASGPDQPVVVAQAVPKPGAEGADPAPAAQPKAVPFPGTNWLLVLPEGFALRTTPVTMFQHPSGALITLLESRRQPVSLDDIGEIGSVTGKGTRNEGVLLSRETVTAGGRPGVLLTMRMPQRSVVLHSIVVEGEASNAALTIAVPEASTIFDAATLRLSLLSAVERVRGQDQRLADLPYRIGELGGMRTVSIVNNNFVVMTDGPGDAVDEATNQPFVMMSMVPAPPGQTFDAARDLPVVTREIRKQYPDASIVDSGVEQTRAGPVVFVRYRRTPKGSKTEVTGTAWMRFDGRNLLLVYAHRPTDRPELDARLARIRDSVSAK